MKGNMYIYILIFIIKAKIEVAKGFEVINDTLIQREKELYSELITKTQTHLDYLNQIEERNTYALFTNNTKHNTVIPLSDSCNKKIQLLSSIDSDVKEKAFYHIIDLNKSNLSKFIFKGNDTKSSAQSKAKDSNNNNKKEDYLLIIKVTSQSISVINLKGNIIANLTFTFNMDLIKVDFSTFDEDNTLLFLTSTNEIYVLRTDIHLKGSSYDSLTAEIIIPTRKSFGINIKQDHSVVSFIQHKLHGNKYIIIAYHNGEIFVLNKDLEMKSAISINSPLRKVFIFNGIIFAIKGKEIVFTNLLGGNTILLSCSNYYDIIDVYYDPGDNLLFYIDSGNRLMVMTTKLTIAKVNENECSSVFHYQLPSFASIKRDSRLIYSKSEMFILTDDYIGHLDLNQLSSKGLHINHYAIYKLFQSSLTKNSHSNRDNQYEIYPSNVLGRFYLLHSSNDIYRIEVNEMKSEAAVTNAQSNTNININDQVGSKKEGKVECNGNMICRLLFNTATNNKNTIFYLYAIVTVIISGVVIYYQRNRAKEERKKKEYEEDKKKTNEVTNEKLQEMLEQIRKIEKYQQMNPLEGNKGQGEEGRDEYNNDDNGDGSDDIEEELEDDEDIKGHST